MPKPCAASDRPFKRARAGLTLVEALVSMIIVSLMLVGGLQTVGVARTNELRLVERARALALAQALMTEILQQAYADPDAGPLSFGLPGSETTGTRSLFDDVDDYHNWTASPPQAKDGTVIPGCTGYQEAVAVAWVEPNDCATPVGSNTGVKRVQVTIRRDGKLIVTLTGFRTQEWANPATWAGAVWP